MIFLITLGDQRSKYTLIGKVRYTAAANLTTENMRLFGPSCRASAYDNGREFSEHNLVNKCLKCQSYFAKPYHSWERGLNENTKGLIRQYFPKGMDHRDVSREELVFVMKRLYYRPKKTLEYKTPRVIFYKSEPLAKVIKSGIF